MHQSTNDKTVAVVMGRPVTCVHQVSSPVHGFSAKEQQPVCSGKQ